MPLLTLMWCKPSSLTLLANPVDPNLVGQYGFIGILLLIAVSGVVGLWKGVKWAGSRFLGDDKQKGIIPEFLDKQKTFMDNVDSEVAKIASSTEQLAEAVNGRLETMNAQYREDVLRMWNEAREDRRQDRDARHEMFTKFSPVLSYIENQLLKSGITPIVVPEQHRSDRHKLPDEE